MQKDFSLDVFVGEHRINKYFTNQFIVVSEDNFKKLENLLKNKSTEYNLLCWELWKTAKTAKNGTVETIQNKCHARLGGKNYLISKEFTKRMTFVSKLKNNQKSK